ncbi:outer plastidial membrane protein porin-like [Magnolia sinica]|uniref:outer plastidial membrane protein porin-like n=1 Tax=Magnolia sinica TaxID=86752 RepID=UPI002657BE65|nr:outer plastidial membrane protein porin-like [Magnolia sinica]
MSPDVSVKLNMAITASGTKKGELFLADVNTQLKNKNITTDVKVDTNSNVRHPVWLKYVEQELSKKRGKSIDATDQIENDLQSAEDELYVIPEHLKINNGKEFLLTDTVGFIQKLPTTLVAAFRATLEEISESSLLVHVVDISHPLAQQQIDAIDKVLSELDVASIPKLMVWNKVFLDTFSFIVLSSICLVQHYFIFFFLCLRHYIRCMITVTTPIISVENNKRIN